MNPASRRLLWIGLVVVALAVVPLLAGNFTVSLLNDIGIGALVALGLVLLTGIGGATSFGQAAFVGIAAYATAWLSTTQGMSPWIGLAFSLLLTGLSALAIGMLTLRLGGHFLPLSHHRVGAVDRDAVRQCRRAGAAHRPVEHSGADHRHLVAGRSARDLLPDLGAGRAGLAVQPQPAAVAAGPRDPQPARRRDPARQRRRGRLSRATHAVRDGRAFCGPGRLALRAHEPLREPFALRRARQHRVFADGRGRRAGATDGRAGRRCAGAHPQERAAGRAAAADPARRAAGGGGFRDALHPAAALRARRADGLRAALDAPLLGCARAARADGAGGAAAASHAARSRLADPVGQRRGQALRRAGGRQRRELRSQGRRDHGPDRPQRRRQVDHVQPADLHAADDGRAGALPGPGHRRPAAAQGRAARPGAHLPAREAAGRT